MFRVESSLGCGLSRVVQGLGCGVYRNCIVFRSGVLSESFDRKF